MAYFTLACADAVRRGPVGATGAADVAHSAGATDAVDTMHAAAATAAARYAGRQLSR